MKELPKIYFEKLLESSPDIVVAVYRRGTIIFYNDGAKQTLGYTASEVLGKNVAMVYPSADEARRVMAALRADQDGHGHIHNFECQLKNKAGHIVPVAMSGSLIYARRKARPLLRFRGRWPPPRARLFRRGDRPSGRAEG